MNKELHGVIEYVKTLNLGGIGEVLSNLLDTFYPVGSYYHTSNASFNPATAWGGTWEKLGEGRVLISAGSNYVAGQSYGANSQSYTPAGSIGNTKLSDQQMAHGHTASGGAVGKHYHAINTSQTYILGTSSTQGINRVTVASGSGATNMLTSAGGAVTRESKNTTGVTPAFTQPTISNVHGASSTRTAHGHTWTGTAANIDTRQLSTAVYIWRRTA